MGVGWDGGSLQAGAGAGGRALVQGRSRLGEGEKGLCLAGLASGLSAKGGRG